MKRYQCIKKYDVSQAGSKRITFRAGVTYPMAHGYFIDDHGGVVKFVESALQEHFQELLDLHVDDLPRDEADREPFMTPEPRRKLTAGWAWFLVLIITIVFFVLKAFTE